MTIISLIFWCSLFLVYYSYIGYGMLLYIVIRLRRLFAKDNTPIDTVPFTPAVTLLVAAYNEAAFIEEKIMNTLSLNYPAEKIQFLFITDGSSDNTNDIIRRYPQITLLYEPARKGKTVAVNRAMQYVKTPFIVFSDANTLLNKDVLVCLLRHFQDAHTGAVAGEKKLLVADQAAAEGTEGMYWKYESLLKKWDAELYSVMGAAGELFAIRTDLYEAVPADTILDDFMISFSINKKGYKVAYAPDAYAQENPSASLEEEYKRKVRISAGGFQSMSRLADLLNIFRYPRITWQYVSHRVCRWTVAPAGLLLLLFSNIILCTRNGTSVYWVFLLMQVLFYSMAFAGYLLAKQQIKSRLFYIPFYFVFMNVAVYHGFFRFLTKKQSAIWDKSQRQLTTS